MFAILVGLAAALFRPIPTPDNVGSPPKMTEDLLPERNGEEEGKIAEAPEPSAEGSAPARRTCGFGRDLGSS